MRIEILPYGPLSPSDGGNACLSGRPARLTLRLAKGVNIIRALAYVLALQKLDLDKWPENPLLKEEKVQIDKTGGLSLSRSSEAQFDQQELEAIAQTIYEKNIHQHDDIKKRYNNLAADREKSISLEYNETTHDLKVSVLKI